MTAWSEADIPGLAGRVAVVTGANSGLGLQTTRMLAEHGAKVVMACRDEEKAKRARGDLPAEIRRLDLGDLASVAKFAEEFGAAHDRLDLLVNNAGLALVDRSRTKDGFETQFGVNHLGHLALTLRLYPLLGKGSRVVTLTSNGHRVGRIRFADPNWETGYRRLAAYSQSKLANILFAMELARRAEHDGILSLAADPGIARTELATKNMSAAARITTRLSEVVTPSQSAAKGALPTIRAATDPAARTGTLYAPRFGLVGPPVVSKPSKAAQDPVLARRLWELSEPMLGL